MKSLKRIARVLTHPSAELYEMKYYKTWPLLPTLVILLCWYLAEILTAFYTNFKFNYRHLTDVNILYILASTIGLFLLWTGINWAITTLLDGKGKIREIFVSTSYALIPYVASLYICLGLSHALTMEETTFMTIVRAAGLLYSLLIFVAAHCTVHDYSLKKAVFSILLTAAGILFVLFLMVLFFGLLQQVILFAQTIYMELHLR